MPVYRTQREVNIDLKNKLFEREPRTFTDNVCFWCFIVNGPSQECFTHMETSPYTDEWLLIQTHKTSGFLVSSLDFHTCLQAFESH